MDWTSWTRWLRPQAKRSILTEDFKGLLTPRSFAGVAVSEYTALNFSAYWNGVDIISSQVGSLPRIVYRRVDEDRERATTHPAYKILQQPNPWTNDLIFWQTLMGHVLTWGNGYAEIEYDNALRPIALWIITPDKLRPVVNGNRLRYVYTTRETTLEPEEVIHIPGLGFDGLKGYSVVEVARNSLGLGLASERFGAAFFGNGAWPGLMLQHPGTLSDEAQKRLIASIEARGRGERAHSVMVAEEGMKVEKIGIPPDDAQFLETREFQVIEVARWLNLPPHKLKHKVGERPGGNLEASQIEFLTDTLRPWLIRIEQECNRKLITASQRSTYYTEHLVNDILRMDGTSRAASYKAYYDMGVLDSEQIARMENLPKPKPKPEPEPPPALPPPAMPPEDQERIAAAQRGLITGLVMRFIKREAAKAPSAAKKGPTGLATWAGKFYEIQLEQFRRDLVPVIELQMAVMGLNGDAKRLSKQIAKEYIERSKEELLDLKSTNLEDQVMRLIERWEKNRPLEVADRIAAIGREDGDAA